MLAFLNGLNKGFLRKDGEKAFLNIILSIEKEKAQNTQYQLLHVRFSLFISSLTLDKQLSDPSFHHL